MRSAVLLTQNVGCSFNEPSRFCVSGRIFLTQRFDRHFYMS
ncbi:MAG TPA: hypothetical protein VNN25_01910 [Thermoanaerobaculia bacterium]|nr:hypothetical protein [Thermoanaerobaculia bacterium]